MGLYRRGKTFWYTLSHNGRRIQESTGTASRKLAERIYAKVLSEVEEGTWFQNEARKRRFEELRDKYMREYAIPYKAPRTVIKDTDTFKPLAGFFGGMTLAGITPQAISQYKSHRRGQGIMTSTLAKELELLRGALNVAVREWEWLDTNPFWKVRIEQPRGHRERWLTAEEEERLIAASPAWLAEIVVFALNTGMRRGEIIELQWQNVDLPRKTATVTVSKNGERRTIPLNGQVMSLLSGKSGKRGYVFASHAGTKLHERNLSRAFDSARTKAELNVRFHDLRHTFATRLVQAGIELYVVKELLGHKTLKMTMRYAHHYPESLRRGVEVLDKSPSGATVCYNFATVATKRGHGIAVTP